MSDALMIDPKTFGPDQPIAVDDGGEAPPEEDRPPVCPRCHKRLVILSTHWSRHPNGKSLRRQLWGCPRGHATAFRMNGHFGPIELLQDVVG